MKTRMVSLKRATILLQSQHYIAESYGNIDIVHGNGKMKNATGQ